jgi:Kyakuja-Dileera-Zisupton transposase
VSVNSVVIQLSTADTGSRFANTDYALAFALAECSKNRWIMLSYDIWCQFGVNLIKRFRERFPATLPIISRVRGAIPSAHIRGHLTRCQVLWAFKYIKYSGETYGEMIETSWAEQNQTAGSTKEQNDGHRHDTLDDFFGYWNWTKYHQTSMSRRFDLTISEANFVNSCHTHAAVQSCLILGPVS